MSSETELSKFVFVEKWDTEALINFLREQELNVSEGIFSILRKAEINGQRFLMMTEDEFIEAGVAFGPAIILTKEAKSLKNRVKRQFSSYCTIENNRTKRSFSSYRTIEDLREVFKLYKISGDSIIDIPQFEPVTHKLEGDNSSLCFCVEDIKRKLENMGSVIDCNEAMRYEYISAIMHASVTVLKSITKDRIRVSPQFGVSGINNYGHVGYTIRKTIDQSAEEILCITEGKPHQLKILVMQNIMQCKASCELNKENRKRKIDETLDYEYVYGIVSTGTEWIFLLHTTDNIYCTGQKVYHIPLNENSLNDDTELRRNVKEILEIIIGILEDRANADSSLVKKKQRIEEYFKKNSTSISVGISMEEIPEFTSKIDK
ncbi:45042_t:CDS:2 [Gigaspora margarita]|uniref:45042_t:CDS:1 n=1 Tax=Gigaspora margarita TaxID=4874 RepID=A0ABN7V750_GIGMA|nr:45042_t:CDS:2 [Gigaspora margarita]